MKTRKPGTVWLLRVPSISLIPFLESIVALVYWLCKIREANSSAAAAPLINEPKVAEPPEFNGTTSKYHTLINNCDLCFHMLPESFHSDKTVAATCFVTGTGAGAGQGEQGEEGICLCLQTSGSAIFNLTNWYDLSIPSLLSTHWVFGVGKLDG